MVTLNDKQERIYTAFRQFDTEYEYMIVEMTDTFLIVTDLTQMAGTYFKVPFTADDNCENITFADSETWETVEKDYVPTTAALESFTSTNSRKLKESNDTPLKATVNGRNITAVGITADVVNRNNRLYPSRILAEAVNSLKESINLSNGQGRFIESTNLLGEVEHPEDKATGRPSLNEIAIKWTDVKFDENLHQVLLEGTVLNTNGGNTLLTLLENGVNIGISQRALGRAITRPDGVEVIKELQIKGYDAVYEPSDPNGRITSLMESFDIRKKLVSLAETYKDVIGDTDVTKMDEEDFRETFSLGNGQLEDELNSLRQNKINEAKKELAERIKNELISDNTEIATACANREFSSYEEAKEFIDAELVKISEREANKRIELLGGKTNMSNIEGVVPIVEKELGIPEFAKSFVETQSKYIKHTSYSAFKSFPNLKDPKTAGEKLTFKLLENYFNRYQYQLKKESEILESVNGMQVSDLNLPYTINAQIIAEMFPRLVAAELFTFLPMASNEQRVWYETFEGNPASEYEVTVAATKLEDFVPALDTAVVGSWMTLPHKNIIPGSVAFSGGFVENTDYIVDYRAGKIKTVTAGFENALSTVTLAYKHRTTMNGEMGAVSRVKQVLNYKTLIAEPRRLAATVSDEAYRYGQSQLSYDSHSAAVRGAVDALAREFDQHILYRALTELLQVTSNVVTYSRANAVDAVSTGFNVRVGEAKAKIEKRNYNAEVCKLLVDVDQAELMSNSQLFESARSRPDFAWGAGAVGLWKGLPVYKSNQFAGGSTSYALVVHPELIHVGIYVPIEVDAAVPTYADDASGKLIDAKSFLVRTYDAIDCIVQNKGSVVKITA